MTSAESALPATPASTAPARARVRGNSNASTGAAATRWRPTSGVACVAALLASWPAAPARAAGGHFDVDDASILDAGRCQVEAWYLRSPKVPASLAHVGPGCRVGPVELSLNLESLVHPLDRTSATRTVTPQLKWARALDDAFSIGAAATGTYDVDRGSWPQRTVYGIGTWTVSPALALHVNAGADWTSLDRWTVRHGISAEWTASARWSVIAERVAFTKLWTSRVGARLKLAEGFSVDASVAWVQPTGVALYGIGVTREFGR